MPEIDSELELALNFLDHNKDECLKRLFDILGNIENKTFLDLFAGTGIIGFEAVSRGARKVTIIDNSIRVCALLKINYSLFNLSSESCIIKKYDVFKFFKEKTKLSRKYTIPILELLDKKLITAKLDRGGKRKKLL